MKIKPYYLNKDIIFKNNYEAKKYLLKNKRSGHNLRHFFVFERNKALSNIYGYILNQDLLNKNLNSFLNYFNKEELYIFKQNKKNKISVSMLFIFYMEFLQNYYLKQFEELEKNAEELEKIADRFKDGIVNWKVLDLTKDAFICFNEFSEIVLKIISLKNLFTFFFISQTASGFQTAHSFFFKLNNLNYFKTKLDYFYKQTKHFNLSNKASIKKISKNLFNEFKNTLKEIIAEIKIFFKTLLLYLNALASTLLLRHHTKLYLNEFYNNLTTSFKTNLDNDNYEALDDLLLIFNEDDIKKEINTQNLPFSLLLNPRMFYFLRWETFLNEKETISRLSYIETKYSKNLDNNNAIVNNYLSYNNQENSKILSNFYNNIQNTNKFSCFLTYNSYDISSYLWLNSDLKNEIASLDYVFSIQKLQDANKDKVFDTFKTMIKQQQTRQNFKHKIFLKHNEKLIKNANDLRIYEDTKLNSFKINDEKNKIRR